MPNTLNPMLEGEVKETHEVTTPEGQYFKVKPITLDSKALSFVKPLGWNVAVEDPTGIAHTARYLAQARKWLQEKLRTGEKISPVSPVRVARPLEGVSRIPLTSILVLPEKYQYRKGGSEQEGLDVSHAKNIFSRFKPELFTPIEVRALNGKFELLAGHHRLEAFKLAKRNGGFPGYPDYDVTTIPALIRRVDEATAKQIARLSNAVSKEYTPSELAKIVELELKSGLSMEDIAKSYGNRKVSEIQKLSSVAALPDSLLRVLDQPAMRKVFTIDHAAVLGGAIKEHGLDPHQAQIIFDKLLSQGEYTANQLERMIKTVAPSIPSAQGGMFAGMELSGGKGGMLEALKQVMDAIKQESRQIRQLNSFQNFIKNRQKAGLPVPHQLLDAKDAVMEELDKLKAKIESLRYSIGQKAKQLATTNPLLAEQYKKIADAIERRASLNPIDIPEPKALLKQRRFMPQSGLQAKFGPDLSVSHIPYLPEASDVVKEIGKVRLGKVSFEDWEALQRWRRAMENPIPAGYSLSLYKTPKGYQATLFGPAYVIVAEDDPVIGLGMKAPNRKVAERFIREYASHDPRHRWVAEFRGQTVIARLTAPTEMGVKRMATEKAVAWENSILKAENPFRPRRFPFIGPRRPKAESNPEYAYGPTGFRPPSVWFKQMLARVSKQYPKKKEESKESYKQALSRIVGGIWARFDDATRLKILQKYEPTANPLATLSSALITGVGFGAGLAVGNKVLNKVWGNPQKAMAKPECPECSKLGVQMVETPTKWLCPRCNYKVAKAQHNVLDLDQIEAQAIAGSLTKKGWREHESHREESKAVKDALIQAGYTNVKVGHGTGTAWGWLKIHADPKPGQTRQDKRLAILRLAKRITGRGGEYGGEINVY